MQSVSTAFQEVLDSDSRNLSDVLEVYSADYLPDDVFDPEDAMLRLAGIASVFPAWQATTTYELGDRVEPTEPNEHFYTVTVAGESDITEPTWPTTSGGTVTSGGVTFEESDFVTYRDAGFEIPAFHWNGFSYAREFVSRGAVSRFLGPTINNTSLNLSNVDRYTSNFILNNDIEGAWCLVRRVSRTVTDSSLVLFVGKFDRPGDVDKGQCPIPVKQFLGSVDYQVPLRTFRTDDPQGRLSTDPLFEGFRFIPISATFQYTTEETRRFLFFFKKKKRVTHSVQWSSFSGTPLGDPVPEVVGGRVQVEGVPIMFADIGQAVKFLMVAANGKVNSIVNVHNQTRGFTEVNNLTIHLGEPGGTGTQTADPQFPDAGVFSGTAFIGAAVGGSAPENVDDAPTVTMVVLAEVELPDAVTGEYTEVGFSDNPVYVTRRFLTASKFLNVPSELIDDEANALEAAFCDAPLIDDANTDRVFLPTAIVGFRRWLSTGRIDRYRYRWRLGLDIDPSELLEPDYEPWDGFIPPTITPVRVLRKRYTLNATLTDSIRALDYLHKTLLTAFRGYLLTGSNGKIKIKVEKPSDSVLIRNDVLAGVVEIPVENVEPWQLSLQGQILVGVGLNTSEVRPVSDTRYSTAGNSITLTATGGVTASGATFSGGNGTTVPATATLTVTDATGTKTVTIDGVAVPYATVGDDTTGTVGGMLAEGINSDPTLSRYILATWDAATPTVVNLQAKLGFLQFETPLEFDHDTAEEVIRVMASFSDSASTRANCVRANIRKGTFKWSLGGREKTINQIKGKFHDARNDFAETPYELNNTAHQDKVRKILPEEMDFSAIDNIHQASRIAKGRYAEVAGEYYPELFDESLKGATFFSWGASARGVSLLLEEGDVVCVTESSGGTGGFVNLPVRIEDMKIPQKGGPDFTSRLYATAMYIEEVAEHVVPLPTSLADRTTSAGVFVKTVTGGTYTLTATEANNAALEFDGTLTSNQVIIVPDVAKLWTVRNSTTGAFSLTIKTAAGTGVAIPQGVITSVYCNGTDVFEITDGSTAGATAANVPGAIIARDGSGDFAVSEMDAVGVRLGTGGTLITGHLSATATYDPPSIANASFTTTTITVTGAALGDEATAGFSIALPDGVTISAQVSAADTVKVTLRNNSGGAVDLASGTLRASIWKH